MKKRLGRQGLANGGDDRIIDLQGMGKNLTAMDNAMPESTRGQPAQSRHGFFKCGVVCGAGGLR